MLVLLLIHAIAALCAPMLVHWLGRRAFLALSLVPFAGAAWTLMQTPAVVRGALPIEHYPWLTDLGLNLTFRLDMLSWLLVLIVTVIGGLVLVYCSRYFAPDASSLGRFAAAFTGFAGAMFGLVTTDNLLALYVFWELTTVCSFLLIGHYYGRQGSRRAALQAIIVTTTGGLGMLGGLIMLGLAAGGSFQFSTLIAAAQSGALSNVDPYYLATAIGLVLFGALTKAAQVPFHFWLPAAMAAPTPVSAYLHAAAMVKAGVYLVARLAPGFAHLQVWQVLVVGGGLATMVLGGFRALKQHDLKLVLAFGTVSQLGFILVLVGHGSRAVGLAGLTLLLGHAIFKACLFLTVGVIDLVAGTRDQRDISGLFRPLWPFAIASGVAIASMAGLPPTLGFLAKEAALAALWNSGVMIDRLILAGVVIGSIFTLAYGLRWWWGAFGTKPDVALCSPRPYSKLLAIPPVLLGALSLLGGFMAAPLDVLLSLQAARYPGEPGHLTLWPGFGVPLGLTVLIVAMGSLLFVKRDSVEQVMKTTSGMPDASDVYRHLIRGLNRAAADVTAFFQTGSLPAYLSIILGTMVVAAWLTMILGNAPLPNQLRWFDSWTQAGVAVIVAAATIEVARARRRMKAVLLLGVVGSGVAAIFALQGAPDLALTQVVVETVTLTVFVLVLRRLPPYFSDRSSVMKRWRRVFLGAATGITVAVLGVLATGARIHYPVTIDYPNEVFEFGYGRNIVNVTLVDTRAWDTLGEISVLLAAATGVASLIFIRRSYRPVNRHEMLTAARENPVVWATQVVDRAAALRRPTPGASSPLRASSRGQTWLPASGTLSPMRRSIILEIGVRLVFHALLMLSLFLLFSGHNNPGGGFAGGMVAGIALIVRYLAGGRYELAEAAPVNAGFLLGIGMTVSALAALAPVAFGGTVLQTTVFDFVLPVFGEVHLATALFFDLGVFLIVIGLVLDILRSLGAQIDIHGEDEARQAPEIDYDDPTEAADDASSAIDIRGPVPAEEVSR